MLLLCVCVCVCVCLCVCVFGVGGLGWIGESGNQIEYKRKTRELDLTRLD